MHIYLPKCFLTTHHALLCDHLFSEKLQESDPDRDQVPLEFSNKITSRMEPTPGCILTTRMTATNVTWQDP